MVVVVAVTADALRRLRSALAGDALDQSGRALPKFYQCWERKMRNRSRSDQIIRQAPLQTPNTAKPRLALSDPRSRSRARTRLLTPTQSASFGNSVFHITILAYIQVTYVRHPLFSLNPLQCPISSAARAQGPLLLPAGQVPSPSVAPTATAPAHVRFDLGYPGNSTDGHISSRHNFTYLHIALHRPATSITSTRHTLERFANTRQEIDVPRRQLGLEYQVHSR